MDNGIWVLLATPVIGAYIYWDYKRIQKMVVPPPPKPAPLPEPLLETDIADTSKFDPDEFADALIALNKYVPNGPINQMTLHEWAQVREMISDSNLKMVGEIWMPIVVFVSIFLATVRPEWWWVYIAIVAFWYRHTTKPYEKAAEKATKYREDSEGKTW